MSGGRHYFVRRVEAHGRFTYAYIDGWGTITWQSKYPGSVPTRDDAIRAILSDRNIKIRAQAGKDRHRLEVVSAPRSCSHPGLTNQEHIKVEWDFTDIITAIGTLDEIGYEPKRPCDGSLRKKLEKLRGEDVP